MEDDRNQIQQRTSAVSNNSWLAALAVLLLVAAAISFGYAYHGQQSVHQLMAQNDEMRATVTQMQGQLDNLTQRLVAMSAPAGAATATVAPGTPEPAAQLGVAKPGKAATARTAGKRRAPEDRRLKQIQTELAEHKKQLAATQEEIEKNRAELEGQLGTTRDELSGSIAKTHDELVALQKRGERNYSEFDLSKSKSFQSVGPIGLALRKTDTKHQSYDVMLLVDDFRLTKKKVNLYEPIWIHESDYPQPIQLVVNRITKDEVHGYVSAPKYRESQLTSSASPSAQQPAPTPVSAPINPRSEPVPPR